MPAKEQRWEDGHIPQQLDHTTHRLHKEAPLSAFPPTN